MKKYLLLIFVTLFATTLFSFSTKIKGKPKVLVFSKTAGFRHSSIPDGKVAIQKLGKENDFAVDTTENAADFNEKNLKKYAAVVFLSTPGDV